MPRTMVDDLGMVDSIFRLLMAKVCYMTGMLNNKEGCRPQVCSQQALYCSRWKPNNRCVGLLSIVVATCILNFHMSLFGTMLKN